MGLLCNEKVLNKCYTLIIALFNDNFQLHCLSIGMTVDDEF
jgi:hypothetical protein